MKITHEQAVDILDVLEGRKEPSDAKQEKFCERVHKVYFSWRSADPLWIQENLDAIMPFVLAEWAVDAHGRPVRPDNSHSWQFAKRWGLYANKRPASLALFHINKMDLRSTRDILKQKGYE